MQMRMRRERESEPIREREDPFLPSILYTHPPTNPIDNLHSVHERSLSYQSVQ